MDILPILATLKRHKTAASLIVLQIALTCAIVCNALFLIMQRNDRIQQPSGLAEEEILVLSINSIGPTDAAEVLTRADLAALRAVPGVRSATLLNQIPFSNNSNSSTIRTLPNEQGEGIEAASYNASEGWLETLGLRLVAGRNFEANEYQDQLALERSDDPIYPAIILNQAMAKRLFPKGNALGQEIYGFGNRPIRIVGIVEQLTTPHPGLNSDDRGYSLVLPVRETFRGRKYVLRSDPAQHEAVLKAAALSLDRSGPNRILRESQRLAEMRQDYYQQDRSMVLLLASVCVALLLVTAFGIVGPGQLLGAAAHPHDWHPPSLGRHAGSDLALLPDRELHPLDGRHRDRHGRGLRHQPSPDEAVRHAAAAAGLLAAGGAHFVGLGSTGRAGAGTPCRRFAARGRPARCLIAMLPPHANCSDH